jgi:hypothetical protein
MFTTQLPTIKTLPGETAYFKNKPHSVFCKVAMNRHIAMIMKVAARIKFGLTSDEKYVTVEVLTAVFIQIQAPWYVCHIDGK